MLQMICCIFTGNQNTPGTRRYDHIIQPDKYDRNIQLVDNLAIQGVRTDVAPSQNGGGQFFRERVPGPQVLPSVVIGHTDQTVVAFQHLNIEAALGKEVVLPLQLCIIPLGSLLLPAG